MFVVENRKMHFQSLQGCMPKGAEWLPRVGFPSTGVEEGVQGGALSLFAVDSLVLFDVFTAIICNFGYLK